MKSRVHKPKYFGDASKDFWQRVNAIKGVRGDVLGTLGLALQNLEGVFMSVEKDMIRELEEAEGKKP